jgi:hypothetical protein
MLLPEFTAEGLLPAGDYELAVGELFETALAGPHPSSPTWDVVWRETLANRLAKLVEQLWEVGVTSIFIDGSFVERVDHPNDIDGYFECDPDRLADGSLQRELNLLDPYKVWTWSRADLRSDRGKLKLPMWHKYRVELFPHFGQPSGILDALGNQLEFPSAFRLTRSGQAKGIIKIIQGRANP